MKQFTCTKCGYQFGYADNATQIQCPNCEETYRKKVTTPVETPKPIETLKPKEDLFWGDNIETPQPSVENTFNSQCDTNPSIIAVINSISKRLRAWGIVHIVCCAVAINISLWQVLFSSSTIAYTWGIQALVFLFSLYFGGIRFVIIANRFKGKTGKQILEEVARLESHLFWVLISSAFIMLIPDIILGSIFFDYVKDHYTILAPQQPISEKPKKRFKWWLIPIFVIGGFILLYFVWQLIFSRSATVNLVSLDKILY